MSLRSAVTSRRSNKSLSRNQLPSLLPQRVPPTSFILNYVTILRVTVITTDSLTSTGHVTEEAPLQDLGILHGASLPLRCLNISFLAFSVLTLTPIKISIHYLVGKEGRKEASKVRDKTIKRFEHIRISIIYINSQARKWFFREFNKKRYWLLND